VHYICNPAIIANTYTQLWQGGWSDDQVYAFCLHSGSMDAASVLILPVELAQTIGAPLVRAGTDYTKCFNLSPRVISLAINEIHGIAKGTLRASGVCIHSCVDYSESKNVWARGQGAFCALCTKFVQYHTPTT